MILLFTIELLDLLDRLSPLDLPLIALTLKLAWLENQSKSQNLSQI